MITTTHKIWVGGRELTVELEHRVDSWPTPQTHHYPGDPIEFETVRALVMDEEVGGLLGDALIDAVCWGEIAEAIIRTRNEEQAIARAEASIRW